MQESINHCKDVSFTATILNLAQRSKENVGGQKSWEQRKPSNSEQHRGDQTGGQPEIRKLQPRWPAAATQVARTRSNEVGWRYYGEVRLELPLARDENRE